MLLDDGLLYFIALFLDSYLSPILIAISFGALYKKDGAYRKHVLLKLLPLLGVALALYKIWASVLQTITMEGTLGSILQLVLYASHGLLFIRLLYPNGVHYILKSIRSLGIYTLVYIGIVFAIEASVCFINAEYSLIFSSWNMAVLYLSYVVVGVFLLAFSMLQSRKHMPAARRRKPYLSKGRLAFAVCAVIVMILSVAVVHRNIVWDNYATLASPRGILAKPSEIYGYTAYNPGFQNVADERYYREKLTGPDASYILDETGESFLRQSWASFLSWGVILMILVFTDRLRKLGQEKNVSPLPHNMFLWSLLFSSLYIHQILYSLLGVVNGQLSILLAGGVACLAYGKARFLMKNGEELPMEEDVIQAADPASEPRAPQIQ